jgi:putative transposase
VRPEPPARGRSAVSASRQRERRVPRRGTPEAILRPRVRKQVGDGTEREHVLVSYSMMRRPGNNAAAVVTALGAGMSTRSQAWASEGVMSKTAASRHWIEATAARIGRTAGARSDENGLLRAHARRGRRGPARSWWSPSGSPARAKRWSWTLRSAAVRTRWSARRSWPACSAAASLRLPGSRLFAVLDGSAALQGAVLGIWPDAVIQRCLVHKERNLYGYLRKGDHGEAARCGGGCAWPRAKRPAARP